MREKKKVFPKEKRVFDWEYRFPLIWQTHIWCHLEVYSDKSSGNQWGGDEFLQRSIKIPAVPSDQYSPTTMKQVTGQVTIPGDRKCVSLQYLEAIRKLKASGLRPLRTVYLSFVPDEEIGGNDGATKFADSDVFAEMNVGIVLDEGLASPTDNYRAFYGERSPWWLVVKAVGAPGHGAKLYDNTAMENLLRSIETVRRFRAAQFDPVKAGLKAEGGVIYVNMVFLKSGTPPSGFVKNLQPSEAQAGFDVRVPPTADQASLERRTAEEWAPASLNMTFEFKQKVSVNDKFGRPAVTAVDSSNIWPASNRIFSDGKHFHSSSRPQRVLEQERVFESSSKSKAFDVPLLLRQAQQQLDISQSLI
ncbi:hypothetical protein K7X08_037176 [Anisodus acutangulus]|uniref:N-acyl-L-amino-acid amidohydrolase n=1 Tax=Anisodus acutangulus TaxID=402998 RepID=A0A9Q1L879_9SOLA|nr:hypothetical protein K7X08_037176 [Anisodus acutangulus]